MKTTIYHNPKCSKSRQTLALIQEEGIEPEVIEYLKEPPSQDELKSLAQALSKRPGEFTRKKDAASEVPGLNLEDDQAVLSAMASHPKIIERPIVVRGDKAVLGRPPENVHALLG